MGKQRPKHKPWEEKMVIFMSVNALFQLVLDLIFEILHLIPTRINHLSLTFLNAFISFKTLSAIKKNRFSFMHEDCQILWIMEICLIFGDVWYLIFDDFSFAFIFVRLIFVVCSLINFCCVSYVMFKYELWSITYKGHTARRLSADFSQTRLSIQRMFSLSKIPEEVKPHHDGDDDGDHRISAVEAGELDYTRRTDDRMDDCRSDEGAGDDEEDENGGVEMRSPHDKKHCATNETPFPASDGPQESGNDIRDIIEVDQHGSSAVKLL